MLTVAVEKRLGAFALSVEFIVTANGAALFGPSGCGKSTIVNLIAGLLTPDRGRIVLGEETLFDSEARVNIPPHRRGIGVVFQEGRLFPHLNVAQNLRYGRWMRGLRRDADDEARIVAMLNLAPLLARRPGRLSGGERQRVAIGRALLMKPALLLLDEPFASLDADRKDEILPYLKRLRDEGGVPLVYVSHQADEIRRVATAVVRLDGGRVVAVGGLDLLSAPAPVPVIPEGAERLSGIHTPGVSS